MPRSRSTAIQSERTRRRAPRAFTSPANWTPRQTAPSQRGLAVLEICYNPQSFGIEFAGVL
jgi:hypothetical protein